MSLADAQFSAQSRVPQILIGSIVPSVIATISVLARLYCRAVITRFWGADDSLITFSWLIGLTSTVMNCKYIDYGSGRHQVFQTPYGAAMTTRLSYASRILYQIVLGTTKISVCLLYIRVFTDRKSILIIHALMGFITIFSVPLTLYVIIHCVPVHDVEPATCHSNSPDLFVSAACNILADVLLIIFVVPQILSLRLPLRQKSTLLGIVSLGVLVTIAAIVRLLKVMQFNESTDRTWAFANITTWSAVEIETGLFCASAPGTKPLMRKWIPGFLSSSSLGASEPERYARYPSKTFNGTQHTNRSAVEYGFELDGQLNKDVDATGDNKTKPFWRGDEESVGTQIEDGESVRGILGERSASESIVQTASITIRGYRND